MLSKEEMLQLRTSYIEIGKLVQRYGHGRYNLRTLMGQVACIDSNEEDNVKLQYLLDSYNSMFCFKEGLNEFAVCECDESRERCIELNKRFRNESQKIWEILKGYIL